MGKLAVSQFVSVDGVIEDPVGMEGLGRGDWTSSGSVGEEGNEFIHEQIRAADAFLMGRRTYEGYVAAWPEREGEYADKLNAIAKYVVSSTLTEPDWANTTVIGGVDDVRALKQRHQEIMLQGSGQLADALLAAGLIDEWRMIVFPVIVGTGRRLFGDPGRALNLRLTDSRKVGDGVQILVYAPS
jgi:dihydrofolate reductase